MFYNQKDIYQKYSEPPLPHLIDGDDVNGVHVVDESALKTINGIQKHKDSVKSKVAYLSNKLKERAEKHDNSKLEHPEIDWLIAMDREPRYPYGSPEYFDKMKRWNKFFQHHYANNRHHPDHFPNGVNDMNLVDLCEYCCDIISYYDEMHPKDAIKTIEAQKERFGFDPQLTDILKNTLLDYFTYLGSFEPKYVTATKKKED